MSEQMKFIQDLLGAEEPDQAVPQIVVKETQAGPMIPAVQEALAERAEYAAEYAMLERGNDGRGGLPGLGGMMREFGRR